MRVQIQDDCREIAEYTVISIGNILDVTVITYCIDPETREFGTIETGSVFFLGLLP